MFAAHRGFLGGILMKKNPVFKGVCTALVTPTTDDGVDFEALKKLIDWQIDQGINAIVFAGTTGEKSTLDSDEHLELLEVATAHVNGRVPVLAGTGSNDIAHSVKMTKEACKIGADAMLCVTPYYNKTTQEGLVKSFYTVAEASEKPIIVYNVPSRTGVGILPETYAKLGEHENIVAIKEANSDISKIVETFALAGDMLDIYSGNDDQIVPILSMGGMGVISVLSNPMPAKTVELCQRFFDGDVAGSAKLQKELLPLIKQLFCEVNPIPVKAAMSKMGFCENHLRLPLVPLTKKNDEILERLMREQGLI